MASRSSEDTMLENENVITFNVQQDIKIENQNDEIMNYENVSTGNETCENKSLYSVNNPIPPCDSLQSCSNINSVQIPGRTKGVFTVSASLEKHLRDTSCTQYFDVPLNSNYVGPEEITIKEEKDDKDNQENIITIEVKLEEEEITEAKEPEFDSYHFKSSNANDPEEILPTNDHYRSSKLNLHTRSESYHETVQRNSTDMCTGYGVFGESAIELCLRSQSTLSEHTENSVSFYDNTENILPIISEENVEEILPTVDSSKNNLLKPTKSQSAKAKPKYKYKCNICHAGYRSLYTYRSHKKVHIDPDVLKPVKTYKNTKKLLTDVRGFPHFKCDKCDQKYIYGTSLEKHMLSCHAPFPVELVEGPDILSNAETTTTDVENLNSSDNSEKVLPVIESADDSKNNALTSAERSELEGLLNNILKLQQCSLGASRDMLNEIERKYECPNCLQSYKNSSSYKLHLHKHIKNEKQFLARRKAQINRKHSKDSRGFTHFKCDKCNKKYSFLTSLKKHMKNCLIEVKDEPPDYICSCKKIFSTESDMLTCFREHKTKSAAPTTDNPQDNDGVKWPLTDNYISLLKDDSTAEVLLNNIKLLEEDINILNSKLADITESSNEVYECPKCFMTYSITRSYRTHLNQHLGQTNRVLKRKKMLIKMKLLKARSDYAHFICDTCKYVSTDENDLEKHKSTCQKSNLEMRGNCENTENTSHLTNTDCSKADELETQSSEDHNLGETESDSTLNNNESNLEQITSELGSKEMDNGETENIHVCPKCFMFYLDYVEFQQHLSKHNEEEMRILPRKMRVKTMKLFKESTSFKCSKCNKRYVYEESLNRHMRQCQKPEYTEKFEVCAYPCGCGKTFSRKSRLESCFQTHGAEFVDTNTSIEGQDIETTNGVKAVLSTHCNCSEVGTFALTTDTDKKSMKQENKSDENEIQMTGSLSEKHTHGCHKCPMSFQTLLAYKKHLVEHPEVNEHRQDIDAETIAVKRVKDVRGCTLFKCNQCDKTYVHKEALETHVKSLHKSEENVPETPEKYPCSCGKVFSRKTRMETCLKNHSGIDKDVLLYCSSCDYYFENQVDLHLHKRVAHMDDRLLCKLCPMEYATPSQLFDHLKLHQNVQFMEHKIVEENTEENQKLKCFICESDLSDLTELKFHFLKDHKQPYSCKKCDDTFVEIESFMFHTKTVHLLSEEKLIMEFLEALHTLIKSWYCEPCKFRCENPDDLADHMHSHKTVNAVKFDPLKRKVVDTRKHRCIHCRRLFKTKAGMTDHVELYHNVHDLHSKLQKQEFYLCTKNNKKEIDVETPVNMDNACTLCKIRFTSEPLFKWHLTTPKHIDVKSCLLNEQYFKDNNNERAASPESTPKFFEVMLIKQEFNDDSDNE